MHTRSTDRVSATDQLVTGLSLLSIMELTQTIYRHLASGGMHCFQIERSCQPCKNRQIYDYQNIEMQPDPIGDIC